MKYRVLSGKVEIPTKTGSPLVIESFTTARTLLKRAHNQEIVRNAKTAPLDDAKLSQASLDAATFTWSDKFSIPEDKFEAFVENITKTSTTVIEFIHEQTKAPAPKAEAGEK